MTEMLRTGLEKKDHNALEQPKYEAGNVFWDQ